jgi:hypothetical protein
MAEDLGTTASGPEVPAEALSQGTQNAHPQFKQTSKEEIAETEGTQFGTGPDNRSKIVLPGRYPVKNRAVPTTGDKRVTMKGTMTRTYH